MNLPVDFLKRMQEMLGDNYNKFIKSYSQSHHSALRLNPLKNVDFLKAEFQNNVEWAEYAYYFDSSTPYGKLPYHNMGLYYIQEPSAMLPAEVLEPSENEVILDLCASPGGKSTQLACKMNSKGLLVSNEIIPKRANILKDNISRLGITNAIVLNESPENISKRLDGFFDKILVDAPCSGEGMFRKHPEVAEEWSLNNVKMCAERQLNILNTIKNCLKDNGILVYSTCTFSPEENEQVIEEFLTNNPEFKLIEISSPYFSNGSVKNTKNNLKEIEKTIRIFPHISKGEGHFVAKLQKISNNETYPLKTQKSTINKKSLQLYKEFERKLLVDGYNGTFLQFGDNIYIAPINCPSLDKLKVVYTGLLLGSTENNRFTPSHELALALNPNNCNNAIELNDNELSKYLHGESFSIDNVQDGWILITYKNNPVGWGKAVNNTLKNHYPKYLRT